MHHAGLCVQHVIQQSLIIGAGKRTHRIARRFRIICRRNLRAEIHAVNARGASANKIGYMMIIYIAGLQGLPGDVIEAAAVDGANSRQTLFNVTIPLMMPSITVCTFLTVTNGFKMFDQNLALTNGAPSNSSELLALNIYRTFYGRAGFEGVGQAKAVVFFIIVAVIALIQNKLTTSKEVQA